MAQFSRIEVAQIMKETGMVPLFYHPDIELGKQVLKACYDGGARLLEFTARGDFAHEVFAALTKYAIAELPGMVMGVGSITDAAAASLTSTSYSISTVALNNLLRLLPDVFEDMYPYLS